MGAASSLSRWRRRLHLWIDHGAGEDAVVTAPTKLPVLDQIDFRALARR